MVAPSEKTALIFGASGITGHPIARLCLSYPTPTTFTRVIGLTARPLTIAEAFLPADPRLELHSGLDLSKDQESTQSFLRTIPGIGEVTHVYFAAYVDLGWGVEGSASRAKANVNFVVNAVTALEAVCPNMEFFTFATGAKWYGFEFGNEVKRVSPVKESAPRVSSPHGDHIFYYPQIDALDAMAQGKTWKYADIRPDAIVGFVPNHNTMNIAEPIALYASLWKSFGGSQEIPFPGSAESYVNVHSDCSQDHLARMHIYASLNPDKTAGEAFNIANQDEPSSWRDIWPGIMAYFGLKGVGPGEELSGEAWARSQTTKWEEWTTEKGLKPRVLERTCWEFMTTVAGPYSTFDRSYDISKARSIRFTDTVDHVESYHTAFDRMRAAKIIP